MASKETTTLYVRNMVCPRCIKVVHDELAALGLDVRSVALGEVVLGGAKERQPLGRIRAALEENGFGIVEDRRAKTIEKIKHAALRLARNDYDKDPVRVKDSEFIANEVGLDYGHLATLFSQVESVTIEQYVILQRIEYAKELLKYGELTLTEMSYRMGYSSVAHLSTQFKKVTGMTPSAFRAMGGPSRLPTDSVSRSR
jgi:AraC family transcriptional regulator